MQTRCGIYLWGANMDLVYPWYNLRQPKISLVYLEALVYTRDIPSICQNTKTYQWPMGSRFQMAALSHQSSAVAASPKHANLLRRAEAEDVFPFKDD